MKSSKRALRALCLALALIAIPACSSIPVRQDETVDRQDLDAYVGQPVDHFDIGDRFAGWRPLGPREALVWTTPDKAYVLTVAAPCEDLRSVRRISVTSTLNTVYSLGLDFVRAGGERCPIERILPVDYGKLTAERGAAGESATSRMAYRPAS